MKNPRVTVLLPIYNGSKFLRESINSILGQSFQDFELLIINDGSIDGTAKILESFKDPRIKIVTHRENRKLIYSLNEGLKKARGEYVVRMDADDISLPNRLATQVNYMDNNHLICASGTALIRVSGEEKQPWIPLTDYADLKAQLLFESPLAHPTVIFRKSVLTKDHLFYSRDYLHTEDYELWVRIAEDSKIGNVKTPLLLYRVHSDQVTTVHKIIKEKNSRKIRSEILAKIGVSLKIGDLNVHEDLANLSLKEGLVKITNWGGYLLQCNSIKGYLKQDALENILGKRTALYFILYFRKYGLSKDMVLIGIKPWVIKLLSLGFIRIIDEKINAARF